MKKTIAILSVLVLLLSVAVVFAAANVNLPAATISAERNKTTSTTFVVKNTGNATLSNIAITSDADSKYSVQFTNVPSTLTVNQSATVTVRAYTPTTESTGTHSIGSINFVSNNINANSDLKLNVNSMLVIDEVKVKVASNSKTISSDAEKFDDDESILGSTYSVQVKVCNMFSDEDDKMENIAISAVFEGIDNGDDVEGEVSDFDLDGDECSSFKVVAMDSDKIPLLADEGDYDLIINVQGEDEDNNDYEDEWAIPISVYRDSDPLMLFETAEVLPSQISCSRQVTITAEAYNIGDDDDEGVLTIKNAELGIDITKYFEFGSDPSDDCDAIDDPEDGCIGFDKTFNVDLTKTLAAKTYVIDFKVYYQTDNLMEQKTVNLEVQNCGTQATTTSTSTTSTTTPTTTTPSTNPNVVVVTQPTPSSSITGAAATIVKKESTNGLYIVALVTIDLIIIAIIIYLLTLFII
jgi:hypothetical protein